MITGAGEVTACQQAPVAILVPLGPEGGAGMLPGAAGVAGAEVVAEYKGRTLLVDKFAPLFGA
jgi:apoptosis-inducing factor 2